VTAWLHACNKRPTFLLAADFKSGQQNTKLYYPSSAGARQCRKYICIFFAAAYAVHLLGCRSFFHLLTAAAWLQLSVSDDKCVSCGAARLSGLLCSSVNSVTDRCHCCCCCCLPFATNRRNVTPWRPIASSPLLGWYMSYALHSAIVLCSEIGLNDELTSRIHAFAAYVAYITRRRSIDGIRKPAFSMYSIRVEAGKRQLNLVEFFVLIAARCRLLVNFLVSPS